MGGRIEGGRWGWVGWRKVVVGKSGGGGDNCIQTTIKMILKEMVLKIEIIKI